jgi:hypothetical protein
MKVKSILMTACLMAGTVAMATNYYAAPGATGSGTSINDPGDIVKLASKTIAGGDSLFLLDGVYYVTASVDVKTAEGTAEKRTFVGAYPGAHPIIDGYKMTYNNNGQSNCVRTRVAYVHLYGIEARYAGFKGFYICGDNNLIENCVAHHCVDTGIQMKDADGCTILNCDSYENFDYQLGGTSSPDFGGNADGFCDKQFSGAGNTYINCRSWRNSDDGWDLYKRVTTSPIVFINCITFANSPEYYDFTGNPRMETDKAWFDGIEGKTLTTSKSHTDVWTYDHYYNNGNKNGFKIGGAGVATDVTMYRCLAIANTVKGFDQNYTQGDVKLYNCSGYDNKNNYHFGSAEMSSLDIRNSISYYSHEADYSNEKNEWWKDIITTGNYTHSSNNWDLGLTPNDADFVSVDANLTISDRNADGTFTIPTLSLAEGSQFINAGEIIPGYDDYSGVAPDLGWKEYDADIVTPEPTDISNVSKALDGARRLNVYTANGVLVDMISDGNLTHLNLPSGIYIVRDFNTNKGVKVALK